MANLHSAKKQKKNLSFTVKDKNFEISKNVISQLSAGIIY